MSVCGKDGCDCNVADCVFCRVRPEYGNKAGATLDELMETFQKNETGGKMPSSEIEWQSCVNFLAHAVAIGHELDVIEAALDKWPTLALSVPTAVTARIATFQFVTKSVPDLPAQMVAEIADSVTHRAIAQANEDLGQLGITPIEDVVADAIIVSDSSPINGAIMFGDSGWVL